MYALCLVGVWSAPSLSVSEISVNRMSASQNRSLLERFIAFSQYCSLAVIGIGAFALAGWLFNIQVFKSALPGLSTMKANSAIAFILAGVALWFANPKKQKPVHSWMAQICTGLFFLIGSLTLGEYIFRWNFGIDQLLFKDLQTQQVSFLGRMGFATALCFVLTGLSLLIIVNRLSEKAVLASQYLVAVVLSISALALVGYMYDVQALYRLAPYSSMALNTATAFLLYSLGLLCVRPEYGWMRLISTKTAGGTILRRLLPSILGVPLVLGWIILAGDRAGFYETHFGLAMISVLTAGTLVITLWLTSRRLNRIDADRQSVQEALQASEQRYREVLDHLLEGGQIISFDWRYLYVNETVARQGRQAKENLLGRKMMDVYPGIEHTELFTVLQRCMQERKPQLMQNEFHYPDRETGWFELSIQPVPEGLFILSNDVTRRKRAEDELRALNTKLEQRVAERTASLQASLNFTDSLYQIVQSVISLESLEDTLKLIVSRVAETLSADRATIITLDHDGQQLVNMVSAGPGAQHIIPSVPYEELMDGLSGWVLRELRPAYSPKGQSDSRESPEVQKRRLETNCGCVVVVPLIYLGEPLGTMTVINTPEQPDFTEQEVGWMVAIASQAATAIGRAQIYDQLKKANVLLEMQSERLQQELTERKRAETALAAERDLLQALMDNIPDTIYFKDIFSRFTRINSAQAKVLGLSAPQDALGKTDMDFFQDAKMAQGFFDEEHQIVKTGESLIDRVEFNPTFDGKPRWFSATKVPIKDSDGRVTGIVGVSRDITALKKAEDALREAEIKYRTLVEHMPVVVYLNENDRNNFAGYRPIYVSPQLELILGYLPEEFMASPELWPALLHPDDRERALAADARHYESGEPLREEYRVIARDGRVVWLRDEAIIIQDDGSGKTFSQGVLLDITARKQAEEDLRQSEERFRLLAWATTDAVWDWDMQTNQIQWGAGLQKMFNYSPEMMRTDYEWWIDRVHPQDREKVSLSLRKVLDESQEFWSKEYRFQRLDGTYANIMDRGYILNNEAGQPFRVIGAMIDITESKKAESIIRQQNEMLSKLHQITLDLLKYREINQLLSALVELAASFMDASYAEIMLLEGDALVVQAATHNQHYLIGERMKREDALLSWQAFETHKPAVLKDYVNWPHRQKVYDKFSLYSVASFPILNDESSIGVLAFGRDRIDYEFNHDQIQFGNLFASLAALVLNNAQLREALREQTIRDPLTGLFNRRYMEETLKREISRVTRQLHPLGIIMLDIDHFKRFNDTFGHATGDELLRELGKFLQTHVRSEDVACRYGGEEFILIMPDASLEVAEHRAELLRQAVMNLLVQDNGQSHTGITLSLGVAMYPQHGRTIEAVVRAADAALYRAKQAGRNQVVTAVDAK